MSGAGLAAGMVLACAEGMAAAIGAALVVGLIWLGCLVFGLGQLGSVLMDRGRPGERAGRDAAIANVAAAGMLAVWGSSEGLAPGDWGWFAGSGLALAAALGLARTFRRSRARSEPGPHSAESGDMS